MSYLTLLGIYFRHMALWGLMVAGLLYVGLLATFSLVVATTPGYGLTYSLVPDPGFFAMACGLGYFLGAAGGVETAQTEISDRMAAMRRHPSARVGENPFVHGNPAWRPEHDDTTDYDYW